MNQFTQRVTLTGAGYDATVDCNVETYAGVVNLSWSYTIQNDYNNHLLAFSIPYIIDKVIVQWFEDDVLQDIETYENLKLAEVNYEREDYSEKPCLHKVKVVLWVDDEEDKLSA